MFHHMFETWEWSDWVAVVGAIGLFLFGGGGLVAWLRLRDDSKKGVRQDNRSDSDALNAQAVALVENQFNYLVKPLQDELGRVNVKVKELETEVKTRKAKYTLSIAHFVALYAWIKTHVPGEKLPPPPPDLLAEDL